MFCWCCNGTYNKESSAWHTWLCPQLDLPVPAMVVLTLLTMALYPLIVAALCLLLAFYVSCASSRKGNGIEALCKYSVNNNQQYIMKEWELTRCECWALAILIGLVTIIPLSLLAATVLAIIITILGIIPWWLLCI